MSLTSYRAAPPRVKKLKGKSQWALGDVYRLPNAHWHCRFHKEKHSALSRPGDDLLSQVLRHSTIGARAFDGRVRDGIGSDRSAKATRPAKHKKEANWVLKRSGCFNASSDPESVAAFRDDAVFSPHHLVRKLFPVFGMMLWMGID